MKNFCVLPWYSKEINLKNNRETVCCWLTSPVDLLQLKQEFINGGKPASCNKCWKLEDSGQESRRQMENRFLDYALDRDIELIAEDAATGKSSTLVYQFELGSLCNSTCITCGPNSSTAWQNLLGQQISIKHENIQVDQIFDVRKHSIDWKNVKRINLLGGEPLLIDKSFDILEMLLAAENTKCLVSFTTNGSVKLTKKHIDLFSKFNNISCCISIDGIDKMFEYLRYPLLWDQVVENLKKYRAIFQEVVVSYTISNLNIHDKQNTINWFNQQGLLYIENYVQYPAYFNYTVQPGHRLWPQFVKQIAAQDKFKGISVDDYVPYLSNLLQSNSLGRK
jgi:sulfatase maturation enzyme AslB (radical SAM superfamily)